LLFFDSFSNKSVNYYILKFAHPKNTSLAENASFDVLVDKIRPFVFAVGDDKERKGKRKVCN